MEDWTVEQVLRCYPDTLPIFLRMGTICAGCGMSRFCTLREVSKVYKIDLNTLLFALNEAIKKDDEMKNNRNEGLNQPRSIL